MSLERVICHHCGYVYRIEVKRVVEDGQTIAVRGPNGNSPKPGKEIHMDLTCPNCGKVFEWKVK